MLPPTMSRLFVVSIIASCTLAGTQASAQDCHGAPPAADSQLGAINAQFTTPDAGDSLTTDAADSLGAAIKAALRLPSPVPIPAWASTPGLAIPYVHGTFAFTIEKDGKVGSIKVERSTLSRGLDSAFINALAAVPPQTLGRKVKLTMLVSLNTHTSPPVMGKLVTPDGHTYDAAHPPPDSLKVVPGKHYGPHTVNLDSLTVPVWPQLPPPKLIRPGTAPRGYRGMVSAWVIIDEEGRAARVDVNANQADMLGPTRAALADMRMSPASLGGCPVKFLVVVPVMFGG
jgi:hypothetical protein